MKKGQRQTLHRKLETDFLLNVDSKLISNILAIRLKNVLPSLILPNQIVYVKNRFVSESGKLISDVMDKSERLNIESYMVTIDTQKAFHYTFFFFL